jgi:hypothetical protein
VAITKSARAMRHHSSTRRIAVTSRLDGSPLTSNSSSQVETKSPTLWACRTLESAVVLVRTKLIITHSRTCECNQYCTHTLHIGRAVP